MPQRLPQSAICIAFSPKLSSSYLEYACGRFWKKSVHIIELRKPSKHVVHEDNHLMKTSIL